MVVVDYAEKICFDAKRPKSSSILFMVREYMHRLDDTIYTKPPTNVPLLTAVRPNIFIISFKTAPLVGNWTVT